MGLLATIVGTEGDDTLTGGWHNPTHGTSGLVPALPIDLTIDGPVVLPEDYPSQVRVWTVGDEIDGNVVFDYRFINSETPDWLAGAAPGIHGAIRVRRGSHNAVVIDGTLAQNPSVEIIRDYQLSDGYISYLIFTKEQESGGPLDLYEQGESFETTG